VLYRYADHPLATYARFVSGHRMSREFKTIGRDQRVHVREADPAAASEYLAGAVEDSRDGQRLDNITLSEAWLSLAGVRREAEGQDAAAETTRQMLEHFSPRVNQRVMRKLEAQAASVLGEETGEE